jgi:hypothetical protein
VRVPPDGAWISVTVSLAELTTVARRKVAACEIPLEECPLLSEKAKEEITRTLNTSAF